MKNKISDLRNHLFETIEALKDDENPMELARAKAISEVAQTIINSAKVEIEFMEVTGEMEQTEFFDALRLEDREDSRPRPLRLPGDRRTGMSDLLEKLESVDALNSWVRSRSFYGPIVSARRRIYEAKKFALKD